MNEDTEQEIRNKLTAPKIALEKMANGEEVSKEFLDVALIDLNSIIESLNKNPV